MNYPDGTVDSTIHFLPKLSDEETMCGEDPRNVDASNDEALVTCESCKEGIAELDEYNKQLAACEHKPSEYIHIRAWGRMMRSFDHYITAQQERAALANAPLDAIYERDGVWHRYEDCNNFETRQEIDPLVAYYRKVAK